ncbi:metalloregulator ArsR/SmtB family transcription factor [Shewanella submarina]|uniref:ArsR/SmtB family transcription factor n=1 Tax=Shewanella submarina TaxID=2016376 RepID=A0ABV7GHR6_9GAMM|nr:metalloregulator ArsR/SmtB family transcription factor [Shewanella submarina]MCL1039017.1 metalloregulator ArsR/SmtB family transcription factor [Shewanella submarina]
MARTRTTYDTFSAIAEPKRRALLEVLAEEEMTVCELTDIMGWSQPTVSKHLAVLKDVHLVCEHRQGKFRVYRVNAEALKPVRQWVVQFERYWSQSLDQLDTYLIDLQSKGEKDD